jgi:predicted RecA/RadA family phage recombinase
MRNYIQKGDTLQVTAPAAVTGGAGVLVGTALFGVAQQTAASGALVELLIEGVVDHAKAAVAIAAGDKAYWDNAAKLVTNVASGNTLIGVFVRAQLSGDATARVRLSGQY